ncbi:MAG: NAD(P)/FAD-dependent oxidoreductase [Thalassobaculum sp.]|uniref:NAD(P)/FAD-dependent oxidoreductase n=1 Tax=Thalassobaculum sp. TaxID=2022740 RepID=UPI0032EB1C14
MTDTDVLILGAGAAGLMCAIEAGRRGRRVVVLDQSQKPAEKIRISGGGRCNFTNLHTTPANFLSANPRFCVSALRRYEPADFIALVEKHGIAWHEKTLGQLFCDGSSRQIVDMLLAECAAAGVEIRLGQRIAEVSKPDDRFAVDTADGRLSAAALVVATGGPSIPKMGSSGLGYQVAQRFGLAMVPPRPALVPLTFAPDLLEWTRALAGVSVEAEVACGGTRFAEGLLFTHRGLSGPSILQISSYWQDGEAVTVDLARGIDVFEALKRARVEHPKRDLVTALAAVLPKRLADSIAAATGIGGRLADLGDARLRSIADRVNRWQVVPSGTEGYRTAEVTLGGVDTSGLSSKTMEAGAVRGLYFIGEVVDVTGHLGGFNFQWAWASGHAAGQSV